jgi:acyl-CoA synthetase (AMP-forming)/AMP-acid ligase II
MKVGNMLRGFARRHPNKPAIIYEEEQLSFAELDRRSDRMANALIAGGLTVGDRVVLYVGNSLALVEAAVGVWKAGGVVVPASTWLTSAELGFMAGDCEPFAIVFGPDQADAVAQSKALSGPAAARAFYIGESPPPGAIDIEAFSENGADGPAPALEPEPDDAMISYTSGTTGRPKGAVITHANLIAQALLTANAWGLGGNDIHLVTTPIAHRTGLSRLMSCMCHGATVVVLRRFDPEAAFAAIARHGVTVFGAVPTVVRRLLDALAPDDDRCDGLRFLMATGEAFPVELKHRLAERLPDIGLHSFYAMTEAGAPATLRPEEQASHPGSVGRITPGMEVRIVTPDGGEASTGDTGEIEVRCGVPGRFIMMREYYKRPDANRDAFNGSWFRTGDVGYFDDDGYLYLVDRVKDMIVTGGFNVYSREVELALESHPAVDGAAVVAGPDAEFGECVVAFVTRHGDVGAEDLIAHCREQMAAYKRPKRVIFLDELPRNVNGKVAKNDLRARAAETIGGASRPVGSG